MPRRHLAGGELGRAEGTLWLYLWGPLQETQGHCGGDLEAGRRWGPPAFILWGCQETLIVSEDHLSRGWALNLRSLVSPQNHLMKEGPPDSPCLSFLTRRLGRGARSEREAGADLLLAPTAPVLRARLCGLSVSRVAGAGRRLLQEGLGERAACDPGDLSPVLPPRCPGATGTEGLVPTRCGQTLPGRPPCTGV